MTNRASAEIVVREKPDAVRAATLRAFRRLGWPTRVEEGGAISAVWTSPVFRFQDDVVVEVSSENDGSRVRVRSASRVGRYDFGQNARHIRKLLAALATESGDF